MVGTGPFKFVEYVANDHVTLEKNADYWNKDGDRPPRQGHVQAVSPDQTGTLNALGAGDIDLALNVNPTDLSTIQADPTQQAIDRGESCNLFHLAMNQTHKPFDNAEDPRGRRLRDQQAGADRHLLRWPGQGRRHLDAGGRPLRQGREPADLRRREGQGPHRRVRRPGRPADLRLLVSVQRGPAVHAGPEGHLPGHQRGPRGGRLQAAPPRPSRGARATSRKRPPASTRCGSSAGPATGPARTTSSTPPSSTTRAASRTPSSPTRTTSSTRPMKDAEAATDDATAKSLWEKAQDMIRRRPPDRPARQLHPTGRRQGLRQGLRRLRQPDRDLQHGLARQVAPPGSDPHVGATPDRSQRTPGPPGPRGRPHQPDG